MSFSLDKTDKEFIYRRIAVMDFKPFIMERVLVAFLARLKHDGYSSRVFRTVDLTVEQLAGELFKMPERFVGFEEHRPVVLRWFETHLVDMVKVGRSGVANMSSPRPLHGYVYRFRNSKYSKSYGADQQLYEMLDAAGIQGQRALQALKLFFFEGEDSMGIEHNTLVDVETQALRSLKDQVSRDVPDAKSREANFQVLCQSAPHLLAEDIVRLLAYKDFVPRTVMVEYLVTLMGFHLGQYVLRMIELLPKLVGSAGTQGACACERAPLGSAAQGSLSLCQAQPAIVVDVAGLPKTPMAGLAEKSAAQYTARIPAFIRAYFLARKLDDYAAQLQTRKGMTFESLADVLKLLDPKLTDSREGFFEGRLTPLLKKGEDEELPPEIAELIKMTPSAMDQYIEIIVHERGEYHRKFVDSALDSLFFKNTPAGLLSQTRGRGSAKRWTLGGKLLEVLLQIVMLESDSGSQHGFQTVPMRFTDLLEKLRMRYGLYIDRLPEGATFDEPTTFERAALRENVEALKARLRELGFYRDLSDASSTQFVTARYMVGDLAGTARPSVNQNRTDRGSADQGVEA